MESSGEHPDHRPAGLSASTNDYEHRNPGMLFRSDGADAIRLGLAVPDEDREGLVEVINEAFGG